MPTASGVSASAATMTVLMILTGIRFLRADPGS